MAETEEVPGNLEQKGDQQAGKVRSITKLVWLPTHSYD